MTIGITEMCTDTTNIRDISIGIHLNNHYEPVGMSREYNRYMQACLLYVQAHCRHACYIHMHVPTYAHTYVRTYIHACMHTYIHTYPHIYIHTHKHHICNVMHTHVHIHKHACAYIHTYTYTYTYIHTHIHTHTYIQLCITSLHTS